MEFERRLEEVAAQDATGTRFKGEALSMTRLLRIYYGQPEIGDQDTDEVGGELKKIKKAKKTVRVNPSSTSIRIQNTEVDPIAKVKGRRAKRSIEDITYELDEIVSFERWLELRDRARKDLFWLGRVLGNDFFRSVHQVICDQFVQKNFGGPWLKPDGTEDTSRPAEESAYFENYRLVDVHAAIEYHQLWRAVEMMLLDSRGFFKSTINGVDCVQWLINCPDIRILILTGEYKLALKFLGGVKKYFTLSEGQQPTVFHLLFPEYLLSGKEGESETPLKCPARLLYLDEPSLWVNSITANLSGWHCDIKKGDDVVTDENSNNEEQREKLKQKYDGTDDLLDPHGFMDHIGTRYFTDDWYGKRLTNLRPDPMNPRVLIPKISDRDEDDAASIMYFCRGCWTIKTEYCHLPLVSLTEEMVTLNFPQRWGFKRLRSLLLKKMAGTGSDRAFRNQQMNEPTDAEEDSGFKISFTEDAIRAHMYQREAAPRVGQVFVVWDWALSDKSTSDYSAGVAARLYKNDAGQWAFTILEIIYDKWKSSELAHHIVDFSRRWGPEVTLIEKSNGADMLKMEIQRVGNKYGYHPYIVWPIPSRQENAKRNRIKGVEILLNEHRLHFVLGSWIDQTIKQLTQYTGEKKNKGRKDDIPDAISMLAVFLPAEARPVIGQVDPEEELLFQEEQEKQWKKEGHYNRLFGPQFTGTYKHPQPSSQDGQMKLSEWYRTRNNPGGTPPTPEPASEKPKDPRMAIFGNRGPWRF